ncbi:MAG: hypothetical protein RRY06_08475 [Lachnospiraceae bacterium]
MTKRMISMALLLIMMLSLSVQAVEIRAITANPRLSFNGTTATCMVDCKSGNSSDKISATLTFYQGSTYVDSWSGTGNGRVIISEICTVKSGKAYKLVLSYSVNGQAQDSVSVTNICP